MKTNNVKIDEAQRLFMDDGDATAFLGGPIKWQPGAKCVLTDAGRILWRLDWLIEERARRRLAEPQRLCNRNTGRVNRVRADGRTFKVKKCEMVLMGDELLT